MFFKRWEYTENVLAVFVKEVGDGHVGTDKFSKYLFNHFSFSCSFCITEVSPEEVHSISFHMECTAIHRIPCNPGRSAFASTAHLLPRAATSNVHLHFSCSLHVPQQLLPPCLSNYTTSSSVWLEYIGALL